MLKGGIPIAKPGFVVAVTLRSTYFASHPPYWKLMKWEGGFVIRDLAGRKVILSFEIPQCLCRNLQFSNQTGKRGCTNIKEEKNLL